MQITMLNAMAGPDFEQAAARHAALGLKWLDLKDGLWGESVDHLCLENAHRAAKIARAYHLNVHCLSSSVGFSPLDEGEEAFRARHWATLDHVLRVAEILNPQVVRLLGAQAIPPPGEATVMPFVERRFPWVFGAYREMIDGIQDAGFAVGIENEAYDCVLASVPDIQRFFALTAPEGKGRFIYDVQNLWQMGSFPSLEAYWQLKPLIGGLHLKGGRRGDGQTLKWASALEDASWPVSEIVNAVAAEGAVPVLCLNPSHGEKPEGFDTWEIAQRDVAFLRREIPMIE